jgi:addiction module RelE/StbE family toxin
MSVVFREEALADLDEIARYIGQRNPNAAARVIARIHRVIHGTIDAFPLSGRLNPANSTREYAVPGLPYLVIYLPITGMVDIVAVFHTSRDPGTKRQPQVERGASCSARDPLAFRPYCGTLLTRWANCASASGGLGAAVWEILWIWGETFLRWLHVIAAIGWIGSSFYFIHLDYSLQRRESLPAQAYGEAWQVHGGGFYNMVKVPRGSGAHARRAHLVQVGGLRYLDLELRADHRHLLRQRQPLSHRSGRDGHVAGHRRRHQPGCNRTGLGRL